LTHYYLYDANGNVGQLVNISGVIYAHYEYDPYGNTITANGSEADKNPYRFSTKYFDIEAYLYYYGYRFYSLELGKWLTKDPLGEHRGHNLYVFVGNNSLNSSDYIGLAQVTETKMWHSPYIYYGDLFFEKIKNQGVYSIEFRVTYDDKSEVISKVEVHKEFHKKYWMNFNERFSFGVFRTPVKYISCYARLEQQLSVSTRDAGEFVTNLTANIAGEFITGAPKGIVSFVVGKLVGIPMSKIGDAYNEAFMRHIATQKTTFHFWVAKGSLFLFPKNENQVAGDRLRFQEKLEPHDQWLTDLGEEEIRFKLEMEQKPEEDINRILEERRNWFR
jgi:RHS repeat-associated protein